MNAMNDPDLLLALAATLFTLIGVATTRMVMLRIFLLVACICAAILAWRLDQNLVSTGFFAAATINLLRIFEIQNTSRRIRHIRYYGYNTADLAKYMKPVSFAKGEQIFAKGDPADRLYLVRSGTVGIENGARVEKNGLLGEVGLFTRSGERSMGATALSEVTAGTLNAEEASKLCLNDPEFAYAITQIMAQRMTENMRR